MDSPAAILKLAALLQEKESRAAQVARLLHDEVGPLLSATGFQLHALRDADPETLKLIRDHLERAMEGVRTASSQLHSNLVERSGLAMAIESLIARERQTLPIECKLDAQHRFPGATGHAVYRIIELALDNVRRHAEASAVTVSLSAGPAGLVAGVVDNGKGFDVPHTRVTLPGTGLILMDSYAGGANLHLRIDSAPGRGTIIEIQTA
ncbi:MAG: hypothetical protein HYX27_04110 [Acidobacteria bacterium]|nr:hypothetical protein [Acidobacteriota bacterium]